MDAKFFYYSIYDRFIQRQPCVHSCMHACVHLLTFSLTSQKLLTGLSPNFIVVFLRWRLKSSLRRYRKIRPVERYRRSSASSSTVFQLYRGCQCTYPCFPGVLLTSVPHSILSKPLAAFPNNLC